jgi:hypothetical protein
MYKTELELEKRLNDIALASVPTGTFENVVVVPKFAHHVPLDMSPDEFDLRDLAIEQRLNTIANNAIVDKLGWRPSKIKSDVTKEMIKDFQFEQMQNIKKGKYIPPSIDLDLLELPEEPPILEDRDQLALIQRLRGLTRDLKAKETEIVTAEQEFARLKEGLSTLLSQNLARASRLSNAVARGRATAQARTAFSNAMDDLNARRPAEIADLRLEYATLEGLIADGQQVLDDSEMNRSAYLREVNAVQQENARRRKIYEDEVRYLNQGRNYIPMREDETADEYKERLREIGVSTGNEDAIQAAAELYNTDKLREKMQEITNDGVLVGDFIRRLDRADERFAVVRAFDLFKKKVVEIFGVNNRYMTSDDLINIADEVIAMVATQVAEGIPVESRDYVDVDVVVEEEGTPRELLSPSKASPARSPVASGPEYVLTKEAKKLPVGRREALIRYSKGAPLQKVFQGKQISRESIELYEQEARRIDAFLAERRRPASSGGADLGSDVAGVTPPFLPLPPAERPKIRPETGVFGESSDTRTPPWADLQQELERERANAATMDQQEVIDTLLAQPNKISLLVKAAELGYTFDYEKALSGRGISSRYPKRVQFGLIEISPHKLFYENILKVTRKGKHLTGFPNVKVSNDFVSFMFKVLDGAQPTLRDVNKLSVGEKEIFDAVVFTAGLQKKVESTGSGVKQSLKDRLALIEGEVEAGNTNDDLIKEARKILQHLARMKIIGHRAAAGHLKQLISVQRG